MVYHSSFTQTETYRQACGCPLLPIRSRGKAPAEGELPGQEDIVDEAINFFRANVLFRKFDIKSPADKLLVYLTLYISLALKKLESCKSEGEGMKALITLNLSKFPLPGEAGFPFGGLMSPPKDRDEGEAFRAYLKQCREETSSRLLERVYLPQGQPNKWWLGFAKRKFMNLVMQT